MLKQSDQFNRFILAFFFLSLSFASKVSGQIVGSISSSEGEKLSFATVVIAGSTQGTTADLDGNFELTTKLKTAKVVASYVGYENDTIIWTNGKILNFSLNPSSAVLDEIVVSGTMKEVTRMNSPVPIEVYTPVFF